MAKPWEKYATEEETPTGGAPWEQSYVEDSEDPQIFRQDDDVITQTQNMEEFNQTGKPLAVFGMETPVRTQKSINPEGEKRTHIVPPPVHEDEYKIPFGARPMGTIASGLLQGIDDLGGQGTAARTVGGGALESIKSTLSFGEWLLEKAGMDDSTVQTIQENFATMPAANETEKATQEILSIVMGGVAGGAGASAALTKMGIPSKMAKLWSNSWSTLEKTDPKNAVKKLELMIHWGLVELVGASAGATITTPDDTESFSGGLLPEEIDGFSEDETDRIGHYIDNVGFAAVLTGIGKIMSKPSSFLIKKFFGAKNPLETEVGQFMVTVDQGITPGTPKEEVARRIALMGETLGKNNEFQSLMNGETIPLDTTTTLLAGAKEYIEKAYGFRKQHMDLAEYERLVNKDAGIMVDSLMGIKQGLKAHPVVAESDSLFMERAGKGFTEGADQLATPAQGNQAGQAIAQPVVDDLQAARETVSNANTQRNVAETNLIDTTNKAEITKELDIARSQGQLGASVAARRTFNNMTKDQLFPAWQTGRQRVDEAFAQVPDNPVDAREIAQLIKDAAETTNLSEDFNIMPSQSGLKEIGDPVRNEAGEIIKDPVEDLAAELEKKGRNTIQGLLQARRSLSNKISDAYNSNNSEAAEQLVALRNGIDELISKDTDPAIQKAMSTYAEFADTWLQTPPLRKFDAAARQVRPTRDGLTIGKLDADEAALQALAQSENALSDDFFPKFLMAVQSGGNGEVSTNIGRALIGKAFAALASKTKPGERIAAEQLDAAIRPYLNSLADVDRNLVAKWDETISDFKNAEVGFADAEAAVLKAEQFAKEVTERANSSAARYFISEITGNSEILIETGGGFKRLFDAQNSPNLVRSLLEEANKRPDYDLIRDGIKAEFLRYSHDKYFTKGKIGPAQEGEGFVQDASQAKLHDAIKGNASNDMALIEQVFKDDPTTADAVRELLAITHDVIQTRSAKPNPFGSNTTNDTSLQKRVNTMIMLTLGVLNPAATKARALSARVTEGQGASAKEAAELIIAHMVTDPNFARNALKQLEQDITGESLKAPFKRIFVPMQYNLARGVLGTAKPSDKSEEGQMRDVFDLTEEEQERNVEENFEMVDGFFQRKKKE